MFDPLKKFLADFTGKSQPSRQFETSDYRLAVVALLVHVADADGLTVESERIRIANLINDQFGLDTEETAQLIRDALQSEHEEVGLDLFINVLKRALDNEGRMKIIAMLWDVVYADGKMLEIEESVVWRIAGMLEISAQDRETLRKARLPDNWSTGAEK